MRYVCRVVDGCQPPMRALWAAWPMAMPPMRALWAVYNPLCVGAWPMAMPWMPGENGGSRLSVAAAARVQRESAASVPPAGPPSCGRSGALHRSFSARMAARAQDKDPTLAQMGGGGYIVAAQRSQSEVMTHHAPPAFGADVEAGGMCELAKFLFGKKHRELPSLSSFSSDAHHLLLLGARRVRRSTALCGWGSDSVQGEAEVAKVRSGLDPPHCLPCARLESHTERV